ncbi:hypothetical protein JEQ12_013383 [Ovis aries]|uniref:Uncharacterized protein n=1 Tax=Ovis aries TaxID=9940 RepID=A0A836A613_SHEEP|nr:hypothetical protein JEQ12_013383 [Ovis aries]
MRTRPSGEKPKRTLSSPRALLTSLRSSAPFIPNRFQRASHSSSLPASPVCTSRPPLRGRIQGTTELVLGQLGPDLLGFTLENTVKAVSLAEAVEEEDQEPRHSEGCHVGSDDGSVEIGTHRELGERSPLLESDSALIAHFNLQISLAP